MMGKANRSRAGLAIGRGAPVVAADPVARDLAQVDRACREVAFCEIADALALARIVALRGAVAGCIAELAAGGASDLRLAAGTLSEELASFEETLPLEQAFRADQRDMAIARLEAARERLAAVDPADLGEAMGLRLRAALTLTAENVVTAARDRAAERVMSRI